MGNLIINSFLATLAYANIFMYGWFDGGQGSLAAILSCVVGILFNISLRGNHD